MSHNKTSAIFYRRGVPNNARNFGVQVYGNYPIFQPQFLTRNNFVQNFWRK